MVSSRWLAARKLLLVACTLLAIFSGIVLARTLTGRAQQPDQQCSSGDPTSSVKSLSRVSSGASVGLLAQSLLVHASSTPGVQAPQLVVQAGNLTFSLPSGAKGEQTITIKNAGGVPLSWSASIDMQGQSSWLTLAPSQATLDPDQEIVVVATLDTQGLTAGAYSGAVTLTSNGGDQTLFFQLTVLAGSPTSPPLLQPTVTPTPMIEATPIMEATPSPEAEPCSTFTPVPIRKTPIAVPVPGQGTSSTDGCSIESPYGVTTINANQELVDEFKQLNICWVRFQLSVSQIETSPGVYNWSKLDTVVKTMNAAGIHIDFPIRCFGGSCFSSPHQPTVQQMADFATAIASRYNGTQGHGTIEAFEIGNEEYDFFAPSIYGPLLQAGYSAIKKVYPQAIVGMYGTYKPSLAHLKAVMESLVDYSAYFDFANFHYYAHGANPEESSADHPSYREVWQLVRSYFPEKPIWVTEVGWPTTPVSCCKAVSPQVQAQYLKYIMDESAQSGAVQRVFWFTLNYGTQGDTIYPPSGPLPAFATLRDYVQQSPLWEAQKAGA